MAALDDENVDARSEELGRQITFTLILALERTVLGDEVPSLDPPKLTHPFFERAWAPDWPGIQESNPVDLSRLLPLGRERRGEETAGHGSEECSTVHYSIT
jgi:hypothetical protein